MIISEENRNIILIPLAKIERNFGIFYISSYMNFRFKRSHSLVHKLSYQFRNGYNIRQL